MRPPAGPAPQLLKVVAQQPLCSQEHGYISWRGLGCWAWLYLILARPQGQRTLVRLVVGSPTAGLDTLETPWPSSPWVWCPTVWVPVILVF